MPKGSGGGGRPGRTSGGGEGMPMPSQNKKIADLNQQYDNLTAEKDKLLKQYSEMSSKNPDRKATFAKVNQLRIKADNIMSKIVEAGG